MRKIFFFNCVNNQINVLFKNSIEIMVIQKNTSCQEEVSIIASMTVNTNTMTCIEIPHTILVVKLPLKIFIKNVY